MVLLDEKTVDEGKEKHVPVVETVDSGVKVKVGSSPHPMEEKHFIEWIEIIDGASISRQYLSPGQPPEAVFQPQNVGVKSREYCNVHGLWKS
jgi:superoxide reductase